MLTVHIPGQPIPQPRHRVAVRGGNARAYIPSNHPVHRWRESIRRSLAVEMSSTPDVAVGDASHPLVVLASFYLERPDSHFTSKGALRKGTRTEPTGARDGDVDNLLKPILDVMEAEGVFENDSQIVRAFDVSKHFVDRGEGPFARVCILTPSELAEMLGNLTPTQIAEVGVLSYV